MQRKRVLTGVLLFVCSCSKDSDQVNQWQTTGPGQGVIAGVILDVESNMPMAGVTVALTAGGSTITTADGAFSLQAPVGRGQLRVQSDTHLEQARDVIVADQPLTTSFRMARAVTKQPVGVAGGMLQFDQAQLEVPAGAYPDGSTVAVTYVTRTRIGAAPATAQFVDSVMTPRRCVSVVALQGTAPPAQPVKLRIPVPPDSGVQSVAVFPLGADGRWEAPISPESVDAGVATFALHADGQFGVIVNALTADNGQIGYLVMDAGETGATGMTEGSVLPGGTEVQARTRSVSLLDPLGTRIEIAPGAHIALQVPETQVPTTPMAGRTSVPFAGQVTATMGRAVFVVPTRRPGAAVGDRLVVKGRAATLHVSGTAFHTVHCTSQDGHPMDVVTVAEGTVDAIPNGDPNVRPITAGTSVIFCQGCRAGAAPVCGVDPGGLTGTAAPDASMVD